MSEDGPSLSPLASRLFPNRSELEQRIFLQQSLGGGKALSELCGIEKCSSWPAIRDFIVRIAEDKPPTLIYGDYDVDGTTASFMLYRWLRAHGVPGNCFLPSRFKHGYGLDSQVIEQAISQGYKALIALDCGTANLEEIKQAQEAGIAVAVIDHHQPKEELPDTPLLNPQLEPGLPPYCAAGLIFGVLAGLDAALGRNTAFGDEIELAGLATIADVVPLVGMNWLLGHEALKRLPQTVNPGLAELIKISRLHSLSRLTAQQAAFSLVPRLNAAGRMSNPRIILDLLGAQETRQAVELAAHVNQLNQERRDIVDRDSRQALLLATEFEDRAGLVLYRPEWHIGVLGIMAARIAVQLDKPVVVLGDSPQSPQLLTGSARSNGRIDLVAALGFCAGSLATFGGHSLAAGVKVRKEQLEQFQHDWSVAVADAGAAIKQAGTPDLPQVALEEITEAFERDIWRLAPFGAESEAPRCIITGCRVQRVSYMGKDRTHLSVVLTDGVRQTRLVGFRQSHLYNSLEPGTPVKPVVEIDVDNWNNKCAIQLRLLELA